MSGSGGVSMARPARGENRFYVSPAMRKYKQLPQQHQHTRTAPSAPRSEPVKRTSSDGDQCGLSSSTLSTTNCSVSGRAVKETPPVTVSNSTTSNSSCTNLDRFLKATTPVVPAHIIPKNAKVWRNHDAKVNQLSPHSFFVLGDLWESFKEWSAYGAGVPVLLNGSETVVQYYVPYLSGIQIYIDPSKRPSTLRRPAYESDVDSSRTTSSDGSSDNGSDDNRGFARDSYKKKRDSSSDESEVSNQHGQLVFEYFEHASPFTREPLADKVVTLASQFPELKTYRSCDLTPSSWISVAWYPIYRIPMGPTLQNLDACFLTYHSLSTTFHGQSTEGIHLHSSARESRNGELFPKLQLPTFGLASYKLKVSFWNPDGSYENQKVSSLLQAAENWLRLLQVSHPDYSFFASHGSYGG